MPELREAARSQRHGRRLTGVRKAYVGSYRRGTLAPTGPLTRHSEHMRQQSERVIGIASSAPHERPERSDGQP
jgi:hypothetical protein